MTWPKTDPDELPLEMDEGRSNFGGTSYKYSRAPNGE